MISVRRVVTIGLGIFAAHFVFGQSSSGTYDNSFVLAPLYVEYQSVSDPEFANQVMQLRAQLPAAPYVKVGFATYEGFQFPDIPLDRTLSPADLAPDLANIDFIVQRARANDVFVHIALISDLFHGQEPFRFSAIRQDVRNAEWFADGWIADPSQLQDPSNLPSTVWITPSRYAQPMRTRLEEGVRIVGQHLAQEMHQYPDTLLSLSGDGEAELSYERNFSDAGIQLNKTGQLIYTDYSPFMVAEFRDWLRSSKYSGDLAPNTDDNGDGHTFDSDYQQFFTTWDLCYFNNSGPIPYEEYVALPDKLPKSGPYFIAGGFDAPRQENDNDPFWSAWIDFRKTALGNYVKDFAAWVTTSPDPDTGFTVPPSHFYTHQIPADFIFGRTDDARLRTSASSVQTAVVTPYGSTGVTAFNGWDGRNTVKTATPALYSALYMTSDDWGIMEYNPSVPYANNIRPNGDPQYYASELRNLWNFRPHVIIPFAWTDNPDLKLYNIKDSLFQKALRDLINSIGKSPWFSWRVMLQ